MPLHRQLYLALRLMILSGEIAKAERLPSSRTLAKALNISRNTVLNAYDKLAEQGIILARIGSGTCVVSALAAPPDLHGLGQALSHRLALGSSERTKEILRLSAILRQSHLPLRSAIFKDSEGNTLHLFASY